MIKKTITGFNVVGHKVKAINNNSTKKEVLDAVQQNPYYLLHANESFKKDREIILAAVRYDARALEFIDATLKKDKEVILAAVTSTNNALELTDSILKKDREFILSAVQRNSKVLEVADKSFTRDKEIILAAIKHNSIALKYADAALQKNKELVLEAVENNGLALEFADEVLKKDMEVVIAAIKNYGNSTTHGWVLGVGLSGRDNPLQFADKSLKKDKEIIKVAIKHTLGQALEHLDSSFKKDKKFILEIIKDRRDKSEEVNTILMFVDESLLKDKQFILEILKCDTPFVPNDVLIYTDHSLQKDPAIIKAAGYKNYEDLKICIEEYMYKWIEANGWQLNLIYGPTSFRKSLLKNKKFIKKIIEGFPKDDWNDLLSKNIIQYVDPTLLKDKQFIFEIFKLPWELSPLRMVQDYEFQKQYLSLDSYYGSFVQGSQLYDLEAKADPEENNTNVSEESESLKQFQTPIGSKNPIDRYTFCLFTDIETHVNEFKGLLQWDALVSYYILFSINEVYCEILESDFLDDRSRKKIKKEINLKVKEWLPQGEFKEYVIYLFLTLDIPTVKDSEIAELSKEFVKEFLDIILSVEKDDLGMKSERYEKFKIVMPEEESLNVYRDFNEKCRVAMPDMDSLNAYLDAWKKTFKALAISIKSFSDNKMPFESLHSLYKNLNDILLSNNYKWDYLKDYNQQALEEIYEKRHFFRKGTNLLNV